MAIGDKKPVVMQSDRAVSGGIATLDSSGSVPYAQLGNVVRRNLLYNWYFINPINQRGQTRYSGAVAFTIDRWKTSNANTQVTVADGAVTIAATAADSSPYLLQTIDAVGSLWGRQVTLSFLMADGTLKTATQTLPQTAPESVAIYASTENYGHVLWMSGRLYVRLRAAMGGSNSYRAVKLELGGAQTLAHRAADGSWVLSRLPDAGEELVRCQRYYQLFSSADQRPTALADYRPAMRANPATGTVDIGGTTYYYADANI